MYGVFDEEKSKADPDAFPSLLRHIKPNLNKRKTLPQAEPLAFEESKIDTTDPEQLSHSKQLQQEQTNSQQNDKEEVLVISAEEVKTQILKQSQAQDSALEQQHTLEKDSVFQVQGFEIVTTDSQNCENQAQQFDEVHRRIFCRKQQSESPKRQTQVVARMIVDLQTDDNQLPQDGKEQADKPLLRRLRNNSQVKLAIRLKSEGFQTIDQILNYRKLTVYIKQQKDLSNFEILDVRYFINMFLEMRDCEQYDELLVEVTFKLCSLIDEFVACTYDALLKVGFQACKQMLIKFENLKSFYSSRCAQLQKQDICVLNYVFSQVRFVLSRFGRTITIYEVIAAKYKLTQIKEGSLPQKVKRLTSQRLFEPTDITTDTSLPLVLLTEDEKSEVVIKQHLMVQRGVWREQLDQEKAQFVPTIVCRVCGQKFYADKTSQHSTFCIQKTEKIKEQRKLNQQFLQISSKATETMLQIQQESVFNQNIATLLQTPTLQRRAFMAPKQIEIKNNSSEPINPLKPQNVLAQYAINPLAAKQLDSRNEFQDSKQDTSIGSFRSLPKNLKDNNGNPLMTPQPLRQQIQLNRIGQVAQNQPEPQKQPLNYFNALAGIRKDVAPVQISEQKQLQQTPQKNQKLTALTPASQTVVSGKDQTPKPTLKVALENIINTKLPKSPYVSSYQSRYKNSTVSCSSTKMHTTDPSCCSVKQGKRNSYWCKIRQQISEPKQNKDNLQTIVMNFDILNKGLIQTNPLDRRYQVLIEPKISKVKNEIVKLDTKKFAQAFEDKKSFIPICASPLITSSGKFTRPQQNQNNPLNYQNKPGVQDQNKKMVNDPWGNQVNNKIVSATPCISSNNSRLQGKQDMDSLEAIKTMSNDAFNISINTDPISFQQQQELFKLQCQKIAQLLTNSTLNKKTQTLLQEYKALVLQNIDFLTQLITIERGYMSTMPSAALKMRQNQEEITQTKVKKIMEHMEPAVERKFSKSKTLEAGGLILKRHKKKKLPRGVSNDSVRLEGIKTASKSKSSQLPQINDVSESSANKKQGLLYSKETLEVIPEKAKSRNSTPKATQDLNETNLDKSKFAKNKINSDYEEDESAGEKINDADISDLSSEDKICVIQTFRTNNTDLEMSFLFQKQLEESLPLRPYKPIALKYITAPNLLKFQEDEPDSSFYFGIDPTRRPNQENLQVKERKIQASKFRLTKGMMEFDIDSFSSQSYKSFFSENSDLPILKYKLRSKSDIVIGTNLFEKRETLSDSIKQSEFNDLIHVYNLILEENQISLYDSSSYSGSSKSSSTNQEQLLNMEQVRFNSCSILPSQLESCRLDRQINSTQPVQITDFALLKTLSWGAYGRVILSRKKDTKDLFAIKVMDKAAMVHLNVADFVMNERNVLNQIDCDFIVRGMYTFQTQKYLYMVMEYMRGGDFGNLLEKCGSFNFETSKFYLAHIVAGLEHLHSKGIVHRDLKPENMLIGADGHIKLTDFGLSDAGLKKMLDSDQQSSKEKVESVAQQDKKYRVVGTADYMAPEVIKGHEVSVLMDFWSLGVIAYEFLLADLPFNSDTPEQIFRNVLQKPIELPPAGFDEGQIHPDARDFIDQLLQRDPQKRLGSKHGIKELKEHPFFSGINWRSLIREPAPWIPPPAKDLDMTNFPKAQQKEDPGLKKLIEEEGLETEMAPISTPKLNVREFNQFNGVSYNALKNINQMEGEKALKWAQRQLKKMKESGQEIKQNRFGESDSVTAITRKAPQLRSISVDRKKIVRPF